MKHLMLLFFIFLTACSSSEIEESQKQKELIVKTTSMNIIQYIE